MFYKILSRGPFYLLFKAVFCARLNSHPSLCIHEENSQVCCAFMGLYVNPCPSSAWPSRPSSNVASSNVYPIPSDSLII